ncbi:hypothetical protein BDR05DRAFT_953490 [Suillus weaverae]|nr:hypothetical protein BDR05DRAFT_953490 [Suillus weaverae]
MPSVEAQPLQRLAPYTEILLDMKHVNVFVYEMGLQEQDLTKRAKIDFLTLAPVEWTHIGKFVRLSSHADVAYVAGLLIRSEYYATSRYPALGTIHRTWSLRPERPH